MRYYQSAISNGVFLLPLVALLPLLPYYWKHRKRGVANPLRLLLFYSFVLYALVAVYFVILPLPSEEWLATIRPAGMNLIPGSYFRELSEETGFDIMERSTYFSAVGSSFALQYWFNILMLVPLGMYLRYLFRMRFSHAALICLGTTLLFELTQLTGVFFLFSKPYRSFDVDDILCNFLGGLIGYWLMGRLTPMMKRFESSTAKGYRSETQVSFLRRAGAFAIDLNVVFAFDHLLELITGMDVLYGGLWGKLLVMTEMFLYTLLFTLLLKGATPGKWLLHVRVCRADGERARWQSILLRYAAWYACLLMLALLPHVPLPAGLTEHAVALIRQLLRLAVMAFLTCYAVAAWVFAMQLHPWDRLSNTRVMLAASARADVSKSA